MMAWPEHSATRGLARGMSARRFACPYVLASGQLTRGRLSNAADSCDGTRSTLQTAGLAPICYIQVVIPTFRHDASVLQHAPVLHIRSWFLVFRESVATRCTSAASCASLASCRVCSRSHAPYTLVRLKRCERHSDIICIIAWGDSGRTQHATPHAPQHKPLAHARAAPGPQVLRMQCTREAVHHTPSPLMLGLDEHGDSGSFKALGASMIMELGVLLPVFLIPPKVVINLSLGGMGLIYGAYCRHERDTLTLSMPPGPRACHLRL